MSQIVVCRDPFRVSMSETCIMAFSGKRWILGANTAACRDSALQSLSAILGSRKMRCQPILVACLTNVLRRSSDDFGLIFEGIPALLSYWEPLGLPGGGRTSVRGRLIPQPRYSSYFGFSISAMMTAFRKSKFSFVSSSAETSSVPVAVFWMRFPCITAG